jgi:hypothetical protein
LKARAKQSSAFDSIDSIMHSVNQILDTSFYVSRVHFILAYALAINKTFEEALLLLKDAKTHRVDIPFLLP